MAATNALQAPNYGNLNNMSSDVINNSINAALGAVNGMLDKEVNNYVDRAKQEEEKRKIDSKKQTNKINDEIDIAMEKAKLMN